jgi:hypothetical protein
VVLHVRHLRRILRENFAHYHRWRCHQALAMDSPEPRPTQVPEEGLPSSRSLKPAVSSYSLVQNTAEEPRQFNPSAANT